MSASEGWISMSFHAADSFYLRYVLGEFSLCHQVRATKQSNITWRKILHDLHSTKIHVVSKDLVTGNVSLWCNIYSFIVTFVLLLVAQKYTLYIQLKEYFSCLQSHFHHIFIHISLFIFIFENGNWRIVRKRGTNYSNE